MGSEDDDQTELICRNDRFKILVLTLQISVKPTDIPLLWGSSAFAILSITYELQMLELKETLEAILKDFSITLLLHLKI